MSNAELDEAARIAEAANRIDARLGSGRVGNMLFGLILAQAVVVVLLTWLLVKPW